MADSEPAKDLEQAPQVKADPALAKKVDMLKQMNFNEIPPFMIDPQTKGLQMQEDPNNDWRFTKFIDENKLKLAVKVWSQGFMFNDRIRMSVAEKYIEGLIGLNGWGREMMAKSSQPPATQGFDDLSKGDIIKKPSMFERIKRAF